MKRLIALILLLLAPVVASAQACMLTVPTQVCEATSGTAVVAFDFPFNFAGNGFSASGELTEYGNLNSPFTLSQLEIGQSYDANIAGITDQNFLLTQFALTVNGVSWGIPPGGEAAVEFDTILAVDGSLHETSDITFFGASFTGAPEPFAPGLGCDVLNCQTVFFSGGGTVSFRLAPKEGGGPFMVLQGETFHIRVPEPSTASLILLGVAGLAVLGRRRRSRVTLLPAG